MDWKKEITACIDQYDKEQLLRYGEQSLSKTLRYVQMNIWGDDHQLRRWHAIEALGWLTEAFAEREDEAFRNLLRRCLWAMNDESGNVPWAAPEVMAAIIKNRPQQYAEFIPMLITNGLDNAMCHKGVAWAAGYLLPEQEAQLAPFWPKLGALLASADGEVRGYMAAALAKSGQEAFKRELEDLRQDEGVCLYYQSGELREMTVGELARKAWPEKATIG